MTDLLSHHLIHHLRRSSAVPDAPVVTRIELVAVHPQPKTIEHDED